MCGSTTAGIKQASAEDSPFTLSFDYVGTQFRDAEISATFYENFGFTRRGPGMVRNQPYVQKMVGYHPEVEMYIIEMDIPNSTAMLEILERRNVPRTPIDPATAHPGTAHFCIYVRDLDTLYDSLISQGATSVSPVQTADQEPYAGVKVVYVKDPDGIRVELVEMPEHLKN